LIVIRATRMNRRIPVIRKSDDLIEKFDLLAWQKAAVPIFETACRP